jgi:predicted RNase H-like nuclease (RuvC/YqgF family)
MAEETIATTDWEAACRDAEAKCAELGQHVESLAAENDALKAQLEAADAEVARFRDVLEQTGRDRATEVQDLEQKWSARFAKLTPVVEAAHAREREELDAAHREQLAALRG